MERQISGASSVVCSSCGAVLSSEHLYCDQCGKRVEGAVECPACQSAIPRDSQFCDQCGVALT
ncbi:MAG: zinc ribbon domain-containing protein [Chloroflexi bacterium]|nr:zinc ribbon domain-containing protein [Chloroflexota bacterium]